MLSVSYPAANLPTVPESDIPAVEVVQQARASERRFPNSPPLNSLLMVCWLISAAVYRLPKKAQLVRRGRRRREEMASRSTPGVAAEAMPRL